eukprot:Nk52_evm27s229 gene=Nk52_evmTU27s229
MQNREADVLLIPDHSSCSISIFIKTGIVHGNEVSESSNNGRVTGGTTVPLPSSYPFFVSVHFNQSSSQAPNLSKFFCGGTLISQDLVLTAGHCAELAFNRSIAVTVNAYNFSVGSQTEVVRRVLYVHISKGYNSETLDSDIALLLLEPEFGKDQKNRTVVETDKDSSSLRAGISWRLLGLGITQTGTSSFPSSLLQADVELVDRFTCNEKYKKLPLAVVTSNMFCATGPQKDACSGDSGGPLLESRGGSWVQIGLVSWGLSCGSSLFPGVYVRLSKFQSFITQGISKSSKIGSILEKYHASNPISSTRNSQSLARNKEITKTLNATILSETYFQFLALSPESMFVFRELLLEDISTAMNIQADALSIIDVKEGPLLTVSSSVMGKSSVVTISFKDNSSALESNSNYTEDLYTELENLVRTPSSSLYVNGFVTSKLNSLVYSRNVVNITVPTKVKPPGSSNDDDEINVFFGISLSTAATANGCSCCEDDNHMYQNRVHPSRPMRTPSQASYSQSYPVSKSSSYLYSNGSASSMAKPEVGNFEEMRGFSSNSLYYSRNSSGSQHVFVRQGSANTNPIPQ